jgi:hypothetical protein
MENQYKDITVFNGGLNLDDEPTVIPNGDYQYAMAVRNYDGLNKSTGVITNVKGNTIVSFGLPSGQNTVIGSCEFVEEKSIIYFVYNSLFKHCILQYDTQKKAVIKILYDEPILNFSLSARIYHANVVDYKLFWTDGKAHPRKINIKKARDYTAGVGGYDSLDEQVLNAIKYPPPHPPVLEFDSTGFYEGATNALKGASWQFAYSYVYDDLEPSRVSEFSTILTDKFRVSAIELIADEEITYTFAPEYYNNMIRVGVNTGHHTVSKILVYARNSRSSTLVRIAEINKFDNDGNKVIQDNEIFDLEFLNDGIYPSIGLDESLTLFDAVPVEASCQEVVDSNILIYANTLMNYPSQEVDVTFQPVVSDDIPSGYMAQFIGGNAFNINLLFNQQTNATADPIVYSEINKESVIIPPGETLYHYRARWPSLFTYITLRDNPVNLGVLATTSNYFRETESYPYRSFQAIADYMVANEGLTDYRIVYDNFYVNFIVISSPTLTSPYEFLIREEDIADAALPDFYYAKLKEQSIDYALKRGSRKRFGIVYKDFAKRTPGVFTNEKMAFNVPFFDDQFTENEAILAGFTLNSTPPDWAHYYQFAVSQSSDLEFAQSYVKGSDITEVSPSRVSIKFNQSILDKKGTNKPFNIDAENLNFETWVFQKGDRVRLISDDPLLKRWDYEVQSWDDSTGELFVDGANGFVVSVGDYYRIEVYRPQKGATDNEDTFFLIGREYSVMNPGRPNRYHNVNPLPTTLSGSPSQNSGVIDYGDVYRVLYTATNKIEDNYAFFEYKYPNIVNQNLIIPISRPIVKSLRTSGLRTPSMITHGGRLFEGTDFNDILRFNADSIYLTEAHGPINKTTLVGYVLKALQDVKVTSIYIGRVLVNAGNGETREALSDQVLGTVNPYVENVGCIDPSSVTYNVRHMYFYDRINGKFYRDSPNGLFPISDYKASSYFDALSRDWGSKRIVTEFLENLSELNVTFYNDLFSDINAIYDNSEVGSGFWTAIVSIEDGATIPIGATVTVTDQNTFVAQTTVFNKNTVGSQVFIALTIPAPNPAPLLPDGTQLNIIFSQKGVGETIVYYEPENRWKSFMPYVPEFYGRFGREFVSFFNGNIYVHESNNTRNTFYSAFTPSRIRFASNINSPKIKTFDNISVYANDIWSAPDAGNISVPANWLHPNGMSSRIVAGKFVNKKGIFHSEILRDLNTPGSMNHKILNGRRMRGEVLILDLRNTANTFVSLSKVIVYSQPSEISS